MIQKASFCIQFEFNVCICEYIIIWNHCVWENRLNLYQILYKNRETIKGYCGKKVFMSQAIGILFTAYCYILVVLLLYISKYVHTSQTSPGR